MVRALPAEQPHGLPLPTPIGDRPRVVPAQPPVPLTSLIGREREVAAVTAMLTAEAVRLLTLTGPGGVGKTRLALKVAEEVRFAFADGVRFVSLGAVTDPSLVASAVVRALDLPGQGNREPLALLKSEFRSRHLFLVLDNFEQILPAAPDVGELIAACPRLTVLITSRAVLHLYGEHNFPVPPLALPAEAGAGSVADLASAEAVRLFVARARAADPAFALTAANAPAVAAICRALDGLPLAIELAAARVRLFRPPALLTRLERRLQLLTGGVADVPARLRTMRDAIAWSYDLLPATEQRVFQRLAVFVGGFTVPAAVDVAGAELDADRDLVDVIATLTEHSLLRRVEGEEDAPRFGMFETIREFGLEQLADGGREQAARAAHASYFLAQAEEANAIFWGRQPGSWRVRLEPDLANLRAALAWLIGGGDGERALRLAAALEPAWWILCHQTEGRRWLRQALALRAGVPISVVVAALVVAGRVATAQSDHAESAVRGREALDLARGAGIHPADVLYLLAIVALDAEDPALRNEAAAVAHLEEALAYYREHDEPVRRALTLSRIAYIALRAPSPDLERVRGQFAEVLALSQSVGYATGVASALSGLGDVARYGGDLGTAAAHYRETLSLHAATGFPWGIALVFEALAMLAVEVGEADRAASLFGAASRLRDELALPVPSPLRTAYDAAADQALTALGPERFAEAWAGGRSRDVAEAVVEADACAAGIEQAQQNVTSADRIDVAGLSPREHEVLHLLAAGMSDREIAAALSISYRTVTNHVASILAKLDAPTRTAAAALAVRRGLV